MAKWNTVAIIGVGLIGGSVGLALRKRGLAEHVVGVGRRQESLKLAKQVGAVTNTTVDLAKGVAEAQLVIVCTPVNQIVAHVQAAAKACPKGALITDCGSTKADIVAQCTATPAPGVHFLGGHPLAGSEKSGPTEAHADLFEGRAMVLTPTADTRDEDFNALLETWTALGSRVLEMSPAGHDRAVASTSHLPHLLASILAAVTPREFFPLAAGGLLDTTRVAAGDAELWRQILLANRRNVLLALEPFERALAKFREAISGNDPDLLGHLLAVGKQHRDELGAGAISDAGESDS
jgi:prephenate dehydrogenase